MKLQMIKEVGIRTLSRGWGIGKKYSPDILTVGGVVGVVAAAVMGARATLKLEEKVDRLKDYKEYVEAETKARGGMDPELKQERALLYTKGALDIAKLYAPAVSIGVVSLTMILSSHGIMRQRNAGLVAAYKVVETTLREYRERVASELGEDEERDLYLGLNRTVLTDPNSDQKRTNFERRSDMQNLSMYAREFDEHNSNWTFKNDYNLAFLRAKQNWANDYLRAHGYLFLNDVYESLGYPRCPEGQIVGWVLDGDGDGFVDFNLPEPGGDEEVDYLYWARSSWLLDFNVDGTVYDKI